jgi:hypothetical protein
MMGGKTDTTGETSSKSESTFLFKVMGVSELICWWVEKVERMA